MNVDIRSCLDRHLVGKLKTPTSVTPQSWYQGAALDLNSAGQIIGTNPNGSIILTEAALLKIAKGLAASVNMRIDGETHGMMISFLTCVFSDLTDKEQGLLRRTQTARNSSMYQDPTRVDNSITGNGYNLARRLLAEANALASQGETSP